MDGQQSSPQSNVLLAGLCCRDNVHLVVGTNPLAAARCAQSLAAGARPILVAPATAAEDMHYNLQAKIDDGSVKWERKPLEDADLFRLGRDEVDNVVDAVFITTGNRETNAHFAALCRRNRIPVNVVDAPDLCTLTLLSTHVDGPLQIGVTTNGRGCKLASRIRREIAASLPAHLGAATARLGDARRRVIQQDRCETTPTGDDDDSTGQSAAFNKLVTPQDAEDAKTRRMRWLSQVCEYWPLSRLAAVTDEDVARLLTSYPGATTDPSFSSSPPGGDDDNAPKRLGRLILAGSGPGHPDLLTRATHRAILAADLVLADKLVPAGVLALIPRRTPVRIARKFPGNADAAQEELLAAAHAGVLAGQTVLRLKQGDPFLYGRGGEEVAWFRARRLGHLVAVLPGVTSALSAPLFAGVPPTQRDVADQVLVCTGTGKKGAAPAPPEFVASRTVVFLMALHRITALVGELTTTTEQEQGKAAAEAAAQNRTLWPLTTSCAVVERASCPDQRVIRTTLAHVAEAIEAEGSRPPGLLVVGAACEALEGPLPRGRAWLVEEGFRGLDGLDGLEAMVAAGLEGGVATA
ncbi:Uroporphyrin-III C-methyltransferase [Cordyceps fumosorosea ARSEF 2679]|uniref:Uroporphyrin-III C-methyltransferase n=1 Tax=Cordyceps fumosorosea (strain ARSEF 2679) TaxID=1081104 RepID=A0A167TKA9_CORFA|nr:Uroporphyrin-III C-methyltransferase [Cordyceps fumosorosea ARSEF 2679]OAA60688.1 Uroporphyrin-III C-methyltransferase [Cordyceps fumosorosea ARSEF 2679]